MTDHEMCVRLAEAMGWTDIQTSRSGQTHGIDPDGNAGTIPNPLESDRDAARLRAWCVGQGWECNLFHGSEEGAVWTGSCVWDRRHAIHRAYVYHTEEPDPCRRERLALCRAVVQALEAIEATPDALRAVLRRVDAGCVAEAPRCLDCGRAAEQVDGRWRPRCWCVGFADALAEEADL